MKFFPVPVKKRTKSWMCPKPFGAGGKSCPIWELNPWGIERNPDGTPWISSQKKKTNPWGVELALWGCSPVWNPAGFLWNWKFKALRWEFSVGNISVCHRDPVVRLLWNSCQENRENFSTWVKKNGEKKENVPQVEHFCHGPAGMGRILFGIFPFPQVGENLGFSPAFLVILSQAIDERWWIL